MSWRRFTNSLLWFLNKLPWARRAQETHEMVIERPAFSTNIFDEYEENTDDGHDHHMFWFCVVIVIFFLGVVSSYYIIHFE